MPSALVCMPLTHRYLGMVIHEGIAHHVFQVGPVLTADEIPRGELEEVAHGLHADLDKQEKPEGGH